MPLTSKFFNLAVWMGAAKGVCLAVALTLAGSVAAQTLAPASDAERSAQALSHAEGLALAKARACLGCHQVDSKRVGPSFQAIAQRYADRNDAALYIVQVIRKGGRGQWGAVPMPGQAVSEQDAQKLANWIISLRK
jgi:cytochrome c